MPTVRLANGRTFDAPAGTNVLEAARLAGLVLEHSCRVGRCRSCAVRVRSGRLRDLAPDLSLSADERADGWALACIAEATSDVELEAEDLGLPVDLVPRTWPCRVDALDAVAPDVLAVRLRLPPTAAWRHLPGQYLETIGPGGVRRAYSIAHDPTAPADRLVLHVRRVDGGAMSRFWFDAARPNDLLRLHGPLGTFVLRDVAGLHLVLLATGTGIAPITALLRQVAGLQDAERPASVTLFWGNRTEADLYWSPSLDDGVRFVPVLSRADASWRGERGHVQDALARAGFDPAGSAVYACGLPAMIDEARARLVAAGLPVHRFRADAFVASRPLEEAA